MDPLAGRFAVMAQRNFDADLKTLKRECLENEDFVCVSSATQAPNNSMELRCTLTGPNKTPYANCKYRVVVEFHTLDPPTIRFDPRTVPTTCHVQSDGTISFQKGWWSPAMSMSSIIKELVEDTFEQCGLSKYFKAKLVRDELTNIAFQSYDSVSSLTQFINFVNEENQRSSLQNLRALKTADAADAAAAQASDEDVIELIKHNAKVCNWHCMPQVSEQQYESMLNQARHCFVQVNGIDEQVFEKVFVPYFGNKACYTELKEYVSRLDRIIKELASDGKEAEKRRIEKNRIERAWNGAMVMINQKEEEEKLEQWKADKCPNKFSVNVSFNKRMPFAVEVWPDMSVYQLMIVVGEKEQVPPKACRCTYKARLMLANETLNQLGVEQHDSVQVAAQSVGGYYFA